MVTQVADQWPRGLKAMTKDFESFNLGSIPSGAFTKYSYFLYIQ